MKKDRNKAIIVTTIFHVLLALLLMFFAFKTPLPLPEEVGIEVDFGGGGGGGGSQKGNVAKTTPQAFSQKEQQVSTPTTSNPKPVVTQDVEQTHVMSPETTTEPVLKEEPVVDQRITDFWNKPKDNSSQSNNSGTGTGQGTGKGSGVGSGSGSGVGSGSGTGSGDGTGSNYSLHGRSARYIPKPDYSEQEQGRVVVEVWVDRSGNVTRAVAGARGTTTSNPSLWRRAQQAALNSKFSVNLDAPGEQRGTITYNFTRIGN